jgi:hypothetical protein
VVAPRGFTFDPKGEGKTKLYYNFGRFHEYIPLDMAERRSRSSRGSSARRYAPEFTIDARAVASRPSTSSDTVTPIIDAAHWINNGAVGGAGFRRQHLAAGPVRARSWKGPSWAIRDEHLVGFEQQLPGNSCSRPLPQPPDEADRRGRRRRAPEGASFFGTTYFIGNISSTVDAGVNPPSSRTTPAIRCLPNAIRRWTRASSPRQVAVRSGARASRRSAPTGSPRAFRCGRRSGRVP